MTLGIVSAMHEELSAVLRCFTARPVELAGRTYWCGHWAGVPVVAVLSRIGKVAAATTVTTLIHRFQVSRVVMTGVAGGLAPQVCVGDAVVAESFMQHDLDASPLFPRYEVPFYGRSHFGVDAHLSRCLCEAAQEAMADPQMAATLVEVLAGTPGRSPVQGLARSPQIHRGLVASGDRFVSSFQESQVLRQQLPLALAVEMEGAAMAQVCHDHEIPFAGVRLISDRADDAAHVDFMRFIRSVAAPGSAAVMQGLIQRLT